MQDIPAVEGKHVSLAQPQQSKSNLYTQGMREADKRGFVRRFLKNAARPEEENRQVLEM